MSFYFSERLLVSLSPFNRRLLLTCIDVVLLLLAVWLSFWFRFAHPFHPNFLAVGSWLLLVVPLFGLPLYAFTGQYKGLTRYVGSAALYSLAARNILLVLITAVIGLVLRFPMPPLSSWILLWLLLTGFTGAVRFALRDLLLNLRSIQHKQQLRVAIYGAGEAGAQLAAALRLAGNHRIVAFFDDNPAFWSRSISGVTIQPPQVLQDLQGSIDQVLLAIPSLPRSERRRIVDSLQSLGIVVLQVPSVDDLTSGRARIDSLRPIAIEDLLGRDEVPAEPELLAPSIRDSVVCVTGAGGSIGSELCRQIVALSPERLILLERSEPALYVIEQELRSLVSNGAVLQPVLGSANDPHLLKRLFSEQAVELVFHAAAYKHVPLVEANPLAGLANNVGSTHQVCRAAEATGVRQVVLISTDKAVRPANVMGASKRLAELVLDAHAFEGSNTCFSMVRFGNVLGSSGSVVPLFRRQIAQGGPITVTHPEIIRYFMTIPEAATLVLQASVLAQGGDVFLLDMGEPVRIKALAEQMVRLSGLSLRDAEHPDGDIEIVCTGLRPGEKLYEELLIDAESQPTAHPLIYRAKERSLAPEELWPRLEKLDAAIAQQDVDAALDLLLQLVPEWQRFRD
tara:strand:- start:898 stop:2769 length:1872 start_codon:yes stop_codon:yes gene_type:complete